MTDQAATTRSFAGAEVPSDADLKARLTPEQYAVTRKGKTERAFTGAYHDTKTPGLYACVCCGTALFSSATKYDSGSGWPSYYAPIAPGAVVEKQDRSLFMTRTEVLCGKCDAHLGHVFADGPRPTGLRYCINSAALALEPTDAETAEARQADPGDAVAGSMELPRGRRG